MAIARHLIRRLTKSFATTRGLRRLPESLQRHYSSDEGEFTIDDFDGDLHYQSQFSSHIGSHVFWTGCYARSILALLHRILRRRDMVVFDVGANEGEETLFAAKRVPDGRVFAFEPNPQVRARLSRNVELNHFQNVSIQPIGLDVQPGKLVLYGPAGRGRDGTLNAGQGTIFPRIGVDAPIGEITLSTLDRFVMEQRAPRIDLIKIDVEGAEMNVLQGGERVLAEHRPALIVEAWEGVERSLQLLNYIAGKGYAIHNIAPDGATSVAADLRRTTRDVFCVFKAV